MCHPICSKCQRAIPYSAIKKGKNYKCPKCKTMWEYPKFRPNGELRHNKTLGETTL